MKTRVTSRAHLVCFGLTTVDLTSFTDGPAPAGGKCVASASSLDIGGTGANAARAARATTGCDVSLLTALGPDNPLLGPGVSAQLTREGLEVTDLAADGQLPVSTVLVDTATGERTIVSAHRLGRQLRGFDLPRTAGALLVDGHYMEAQILACREARALGIPVIFDGGSHKPGVERLLAHVDYAIFSADFRFPSPDGDQGPKAAAVSGVVHAAEAPPAEGDAGARVMREALAYGAGLAAITAGPNPVRVAHGEGVETLPVAASPRQVVNTNGAGDVLHGVFAAQIAMQKPWREALTTAIARATERVAHPSVGAWLTSVI